LQKAEKLEQYYYRR